MSTMKYENSHNVSTTYDDDTGEFVIRFEQGEGGSITHTFKTSGMVAHMVENEPARVNF